MFTAPPSPYLVAFDGSFQVQQAPARPPADAPGKQICQQRLSALVDELHQLQRVFYADGRRALLLIFQAMDAGGKDSTIRAVLSGVNPAGCRVYSFQRPSAEERAHDFLWRTTLRLPARGMIGVFNRSYYEEVLVVREHPELLAAQQLPEPPPPELWAQRLESIRDHEKHLARNSTVILKFWLNVSPEEQRRRFLRRMEDPRRHWKFEPADVAERAHWDGYMRAYEEALAATSRPWAPWYALPADKKPYLRAQVAQIIVDTLKALALRFPPPSIEQQRHIAAAAAQLQQEERQPPEAQD